MLWLLSAIGACVSYGGFRACRRDNRIEVEHGLLQHRFQGVDVDRVHVMVRGRMVAEGDSSLIESINEQGFEQFEQAGAEAAREPVAAL